MLERQNHACLSSQQPESHSALIAHKLSRLNINICTLNEVSFQGEGGLQEHGAGYTFLWSGKPTTEGRLSGVDFMISTSIALQPGKSTNWSFRPHEVHAPITENKRYATLFSVYASALRAKPAAKDKFYSGFRSYVQHTPTSDKVIVLDDFNAKVGQDADFWKGVLGRR